MVFWPPCKHVLYPDIVQINCHSVDMVTANVAGIRFKIPAKTDVDIAKVTRKKSGYLLKYLLISKGFLLLVA